MSSAERAVASRISERLDVLGLAMLANANQRVDVSIGDAAVEAPSVGTGQALGVHVDGGAVPETVERSAHSPCFEMGRLEREPARTPEPRQKEEEEEQEQVHLKGHKDPRCLNDAAWTMIKEE